jgi:hypothetical protein
MLLLLLPGLLLLLLLLQVPALPCRWWCEQAHCAWACPSWSQVGT